MAQPSLFYLDLTDRNNLVIIILLNNISISLFNVFLCFMLKITEVKVYKPTINDFEDVAKYLKFIENDSGMENGTCKVSYAGVTF